MTIQVNEMSFVCESVSSNAFLERFEFNWITSYFVTEYAYAGRVVSSCKFVSVLDGGISFEISIISKDSKFVSLPAIPSMQLKLQKIDEQKCHLNAIVFLEIQDSTRKVWSKEFLETQFSQGKNECISKSFDFPIANYYYANPSRSELECFFPPPFKIKGFILLHRCQEKEISEYVCKNTIQLQSKKDSGPLHENVNQLQSDLKKLLQSGIHADVKFHAGKDVIHAHKNILCSRSDVFKRMFEQNMEEKETSSVRIADIEKTVFEVFLIFVYTGTIQDKKLDVVMSLYSVADKYAVETLFNTCSNILASYISEKTVAPLLKLADMHNDSTLKTAVIDFICKHFPEVVKTDSWDTLLNTDPRLASYALKQVSISAAKSVESVVTQNQEISSDGMRSGGFFGIPGSRRLQHK